MKPIRECDRQERMLRALLVLEGLASCQEDIMNKMPETPLEHFVHDVYAIAHAASGKCCEGGSENWLDKIDASADILKKAGMMDLEEILRIGSTKRASNLAAKGLVTQLTNGR